jgi:hypothetical protein
VPAGRCEVDHVLAWTDGDGPTIVANLRLLCKYHHTAKHSPGFGYEHALGAMIWTVPSGRRYVKPHAAPPGRHSLDHSSVSIDLTGYAHAPGPTPHMRH